MLIWACNLLHAQYFTQEKIIYLSSTVLSSTLEGIGEGNLYQKYYSGHSKDAIMSYDRNYHVFKALHLASFIGTGITISLDSKMDYMKIASDLVLTGAIQWWLHDGIINVYRKKPWFYMSDYQRINSTGVMDGWVNQPWIKISVLALAILINYLIFS